MANNYEKKAASWFKNWGEQKIVLKVVKISANDEILTVQKKQIARRVDKTKRILEITTWQIEIEARQLKTDTMWMKKRIEKEKLLLLDVVGTYMLEVLTRETLKGYKKKN